MQRLWVLFALGLTLILPVRIPALERLEPPYGCYLGFNVGARDSISRLGSRLGIIPAVYAQFFKFPLSQETQIKLSNFLAEVDSVGGIALVTLEPWGGLQSVTELDCVDFAKFCAAHESQSTGGLMICFGHEMNGNWYPWGQQPTRYKEKFRLLARNVHSVTRRTALLWSPNHGIGYPFSTTVQVVPGSADFQALDTNGDGVLSQSDDMYEPYYPGDDAVDWVGLTIYHWGDTYPWLDNKLPRAHSFSDALTGNKAVPNFYERYCADGVHNKPLAIPETAAVFNTEQPGPGELAIKQAWWQQVFNISGDSPASLDVAEHFPKLKCINWFDHYKQESEAQWIDWRVSAHPIIRPAFVHYVRTLRNGQPYFLTAPEFQCLQTPFCIAPKNLPRILPLRGSVAVSLYVKAPVPCDLVIDLLDKNFDWRGGTRVPVRGNQTITTSFAISVPLDDGTSYRWSIFLTPPGKDYLSSLAAYKGLDSVARSIDPFVQILCYPPIALLNQKFVTRVRYSSTEAGVVQINLRDADSVLRGSASVPVTESHGTVDVTISPGPGIIAGKYFLESVIGNSSTGEQTVLAGSAIVPIELASNLRQDKISIVPEMTTIASGEVFRVYVGYSAISKRDLHVDLFDASTNFLVGAVQPVGSGSRICEMTISYPTASPGEYLLRGFITPTAGSSSNALARDSDQRINVVTEDYERWIESHWGVVLANDSVNPWEDPDEDGITNGDEFLTLSNPRDASDPVSIQVRLAGTQLIVSWQSARQHNYQLFETSNLQTDSWKQVGETLAGTGEKLEVLLGFANTGPRKFYRLGVLMCQPGVRDD